MGTRVRPHYAWAIFAATCVLSFVGFGLTLNTASIYWSPLTADLGVSMSAVSLMSTFSGLAGALALGLAAPLYERIDLRWLLSVAVVLIAGAYLLSAVAPNLAVLYIANIVLGVTKAVAVLMPIPILLGNWFDKHLGLVTGIAGAMTAVGGAVFSPLIASVISAQGWRAGYLLTAGVVLVTLLPLTLFVTKLRPTGSLQPYGRSTEVVSGAAATAGFVPGLTARQAFRTLPFLAFALVGVLLQFAGSLVQHIPAYLATAQGLSLTVASSIFSALLLGAAIGKFAMGLALDHLKPVLALGLFLLLAAFGWGGLHFLSGEGALTGASFSAGMAQAINLVAAVVLLREVFGPREYSKVLGPILMVGSLANAAGVYLHGVLRDATGSYTTSLLGNVGIFVLATVLLLVATATGRRLKDRYASSFSASENVVEPTAEPPAATTGGAGRPEVAAGPGGSVLS